MGSERSFIYVLAFGGFCTSLSDALELRMYLHDRHLMAYADTLESSGKNLSELLATSPTELTTEYKMRRGHVARFLDRGSACGTQIPHNLVLHPAHHIRFTSTPRKKATTAAPFGVGSKPPPTSASSDHQSSTAPTSPTPRFDQTMNYFHVVSNSNTAAMMMSPHNPSVSFMARMSNAPGSGRPSFTSDSEYKGSSTAGQALAADQAMSKGIFAAPVAEPRCCGLVRLGALKEEVTSLAVLERIMVQQLTPAYGKGENPFYSKGPASLAPPVKASELWAEQPTLVLCLRRPGCVMCRAEAHQLYSRKPIFDAMGIQMVVCLNEHIDAEVRSFWPRYWGGMVVVDKHRGFFQALGQGKLPKEGFVAGFLFNGVARANYKRATAIGVEGNYVGKGTIKGGLYIVKRGCGGVAYQFVERNFGDWAPLPQVLQVCSHIMLEQ